MKQGLSQPELTACIVGLGLMGGSLAAAWRLAGWPARIVGVNRSPAALADARAAGVIDCGTTDLAEGLAGADIVVLATPVRTILRLLPQVARAAKAGALIMDLGSSKREICAAMADLPGEVQPIGGHPLCGKETTGFGASDASLYRGRPFVLCPLSRTADATIRLAEALARAAGARPVLLEPAVHDRAVAAISHLPYAVSAALAGTVADGGDPLAWSLAASGFRDTSRVAGSDVDMMLDTLLTNRQAVLEWLDSFDEALAGLRNALASGDDERLRARLTAAREGRLAIAQAAGW
jgi:prephenate dehydrogenase